MAETQPRVRVFAGPNGFGKNRISGVLPKEWLGTYLNADRIEKALRLDGKAVLLEEPLDITAE